MKKIFLLMIVCASWTQLSYAQIKLGSDTTLAFASIDEGKRILASPDAFVRAMSPFDRASRMKTDRDVSEKEFLEFVGKNILSWNDTEKEKIAAAFQGIRAEIEAFSLPFPPKIFFVKTTGQEEGGAPYTRGNAIVLPQGAATKSIGNSQRVISHELFHIITRKNPDLREKLYAIIGFEKCGEIAFPPELKSRKITNPDAPQNDHCIRLKVEKKAQWAIPILFSKTEKYNTKQGGEFFRYLQFKFLLVERKENTPTVKAMRDGQAAKLITLQQDSGYFEQIGRNTGYIIHPEEILADNFSLLLQRKRDLPSPEIVKKMEAILKERKNAE